MRLPDAWGTPGVVGTIVLLLPPLTVLCWYFVAGPADTFDYLYGWFPLALLAVAGVLAVRQGRRIGFTPDEYSVAGIWATGIGAFVGVSVMVTLGIQLGKGGVVIDPWFVVSNWTLTGTAIGALIGIYDGDRRVRIRQAMAATTREHRFAQQLSVLNRVLRHDVRTAVNVIDGYVETVDPDTDREVHAIERIRARARHLDHIAENARVLQDLLSTDEVEAVDVGRYLAERLESITDRYPSLTTTTSIETGTVASVPPGFTAALDVALELAIQHDTARAAELGVACRHGHDGDGPCVEVEIRDNGDALTAVERVVYESAEETPLVHASGVDIWMVKWAVEEANGEFEFHSDGERNRMVMRLPAT